MIDPQLLEILACPACKTEVKLDGDRLVCIQCGRRYPIREGIPVMLIEEAQQGPSASAPADELRRASQSVVGRQPVIDRP